MPLHEYRRKRDAQRTPEPVPATDPDTRGAGTRFVIQEHHARSLHWDVRLERDGVLASWAVPKGLPTDPDTVRLAVRTEDHPIEYLQFHGEIPAGEYGAGSMTIWDTGTYDTEKWQHREVAVVLHGERARGRYVFLRAHRGGDRDREEWLLKRVAGQDDDREPLPRDHPVMDAVDADELPTGTRWWPQVGFGGLRVLVRIDGGRLRVDTADPDGTGGVDLTSSLPRLRGLGPSLSAMPALLDGELVGDRLQNTDLWLGDLLHLDGHDTTALPYRERRALLEGLPLQGPHWRPAPVFPDAGPEVLAAVAELGLPFVIAKDADAPYTAGRSEHWVRVTTGAPLRPPPPVPRAVRHAEHRVGRARLTNPAKVLYPLTGTTKAQVWDYYQEIAPVLLPHLRHRPLTMVRWPDGVDHGSFFEKDVSRHAPDWIRTARVGTPGGRSETADFPVLDDAEGLAWATNLAALELHVPQWKVGADDTRDPPDLLVFDLDPGEGTTVVDCARVALQMRELLAADGLTAHPRTSGGKGMQLYVPVTVTDPDETSTYAKAIAEHLAADDRRVTAVMAKARRHGRIFVDWSQNNPYKTTIASYSLRGRARPTVATPLTWDEVGACRRPEDLRFTLDDVPARVADHGDLLAPLLPGERRTSTRLPRHG